MHLTYKVTPWAHQLQAIERAKSLDSFALFFEQGCGKTGTAINCFRWKCGVERRALRTLILCPPIVVSNWKRELLIHSQLSESEIKTLTGSQTNRLKQSITGTVLITNYEGLLMKSLFERLKEWAPEFIIFDESHKLKSTSSRRTKLAAKLAVNAKYKLLLTGTPIVNSLEDIFSQYLILDGGKTFGRTMASFRDDYFDDLNKGMPRHCYFPNRVPKPNAMAQIGKAIAPSSMRVMKEHCLDLPPLVRERFDVDLSPEQRRVYNELERDMVAELKNDAFVVTDMELTKAMRLQQIVAGFCKDTEGQIVRFENPRIRALEDVLESIGDKQSLIWSVWSESYYDIRTLLQKMDISFVEITGETPMRLRDQHVDEFEKGTRRVMLAHPRAAGIGVNLTAASYSIFYSRSFSLEDDLQAEARNHRGGSERHNKITRIDLVAPKTIDEVVLEALRNKLNVSEAVLMHLKGSNGTEQHRLGM